MKQHVMPRTARVLGVATALLCTVAIGCDQMSGTTAPRPNQTVASQAKRFQSVVRGRHVSAPPGQGRDTSEAAAFDVIGGAPPLGETTDETDHLIISILTDVSPSVSWYEVEGDMEQDGGARVCAAAEGYFSTPGDFLPVSIIDKHGCATNYKSVTDSHPNRCGEGIHVTMGGLGTVGAEKVPTLLGIPLPGLTVWGPTIKSLFNECNKPPEGGCSGGGGDDDPGDGEIMATPMCGGGGGGGSDYECSWYQLQISYDDGATWSDYGDPFQVCEYLESLPHPIVGDPIVSMNRKARGIVAAASRSGATSTASAQAVTILGTRRTPGTAAIVTRDLRHPAEPIVAVDTARAEPEDLEAALLAIPELTKTQAPPGATHLRSLVGSHSLSVAGATRAAGRAQNYLRQVRGSTEQRVNGVGTGRAIHVEIESPVVVRKAK